MPTSAHHHIGLRVTDIDRSAKFYIEALGATYVTLPYAIEPEFAEIVMDGPPGVSFKVCTLAFDEGAIELFEFTLARLADRGPAREPGEHHALRPPGRRRPRGACEGRGRRRQAAVEGDQPVGHGEGDLRPRSRRATSSSSPTPRSQRSQS